MSGRILAIGDVHGCCRALSTLLEVLRPEADDTVVMLGDLINRGPDSRGVTERLLALKKECRVIAIMGNHDEMFLHSLEHEDSSMSRVSSGSAATLSSYGGSLDLVPESHRAFFQSLRSYWETDTHIFVHAGVNPAIPLDQQTSIDLRWAKLEEDQPRHCSGKVVVCGHTQQRSGVPVMNDNIICIDTAAYAGHWLTCLDAGSERIWQSSELGLVRGPFHLREIARSLTCR